MARPDGRIEKGQRLSSAISARAWNRAQEAADRVLGVTPGFEVTQASPSSSVVTMTATILKAAADGEMSGWPAHLVAENGTKLRVGYGISLDIAPLNIPALPNWNGTPQKVDNLSDLGVVQPGISGRYVKLGGTGAGSEIFGVVTSISINEATETTPATYSVTFIVSGVFTCRCIAFALTDRLLGPPPIPANNDAKPLWHPYPMMSPAGTAHVLAYGGYWQVGPDPWPRIYEVVARM